MDTQRIAALYVDPKGCYANLEGVELWDEARDARNYPGPWPVVAHPPCGRWAMPLAKVNQTRYGHKVGDDGGCFYEALMCLLAYGGVLEHPAHTAAWKEFGLLKPVRGSWQEDERNAGWVTEVSQVAYGHRARKRTWLFYVGWSPPPDLDWSEPEPTATTSWLQRTSVQRPRLSKREASATPIPFRDLLIDIARSCTRLEAWNSPPQVAR